MIRFYRFRHGPNVISLSRHNSQQYCLQFKQQETATTHICFVCSKNEHKTDRCHDTEHKDIYLDYTWLNIFTANFLVTPSNNNLVTTMTIKRGVCQS